MFFIVSKLLIFFTYPLSWALALLIAGLVIKNARKKRRCFMGSLLILLIFSSPFILIRVINAWDIRENTLTKKGTYSCAIVLGGFSSEDVKGDGFFNGAADRFIQGVRLYDIGKVSHVLISGGNASLIHDKFEEADWVKTQLQQFKLPDSCILIENRSRNTIENAAFSKLVLQKSQLRPPYVLVTSAFHMRRALSIFKKAGIDVVPYSCNYMTGGGSKFSFDELIPDVGTIGGWNFYIKEMVGMLVNKFR